MAVSLIWLPVACKKLVGLISLHDEMMSKIALQNTKLKVHFLYCNSPPRLYPYPTTEEIGNFRGVGRGEKNQEILEE